MDAIKEAIDNLEEIPAILEPNEIRITVRDGLISVEEGVDIPQNIVINLCDFDTGNMTPDEITEHCKKINEGGYVGYCIMREM